MHLAAPTPVQSELRQLELDVAEAHEQQAATSEILRVISRSPGDARPVFDAIVTSAARLCEAQFAHVVLQIDGRVAAAAHTPCSPEFADYLARGWEVNSETTAGRAVLQRQPLQVLDFMSEPGIRVTAAHRSENVRTVLAVPMLRGDRVLGVIGTWRREVRAFSARQIALLQTFAEQAVIALENVRLFSELEERNRELSEALEQQTATSEILRVISRSPTDVQPVFDTIARSALALCSASSANVFRFDGELMHVAAMAIRDRKALDQMRSAWPRPAASLDTGASRAVMARDVVIVTDVLQDEGYAVKDAAVAAGFRSVISVPLMQDDTPIGAIAVGRAEAGSFPQKQVALLKTFADQAAIAIENARLFQELQARNRELTEALEQRTATSEILRVISSSPSDVQPVFQTIATAALRLCNASVVNMVTYDGQLLHIGALATRDPGNEAARRLFPTPPGPATAVGRAVLARDVVSISDVLEDPDYTFRDGAQFGVRSVLGIPLLREGVPIGALAICRPEPGSFPETQSALLKTFADQAVIAIENTRLFHKLEEKSQQLEIASKHKSAFLANMSHELRTPLNAIIGFTRIVMRQSRERLEERQFENLEKILASGQHLLALINTVLDLAKIEAGHVEVTPAEINLASSLEHCMRTVEPLIRDSVTLVRSFADDLPRVVVDEEKLRRIVINLLSNAARFTERGSIRLTAEVAADSIEITVADTGIGIPDDKLESIFEEFEQVDSGNPRGGTGLGLAIARRLARLMGGDVRVASTPGTGSTFTLTLPIHSSAHGE